MTISNSRHGHIDLGLSGLAALIASGGGAVGLFGTYWDDSWHTDRGRDSFAIPPHLTLYGGVLITGIVVLGWGFAAWRRAGWGRSGLRRALRFGPLMLAGAGGTTVLAAAPVDNYWHVRFGRDAVLWSSPHMLAVAGSATLIAAVLAGLRDSTDRVARAARTVLGALLLATLLIPVMEYDSDVPQFSPLLYLPVTTGGCVLAFLMLRGRSTGSWTATRAAAATTLLRAAIVVALAGMAATLTVIPPVIVPAFVDDLLVRRRVGDTTRALVVALVVPLSWTGALALQPGVATPLPVHLIPAETLGCLAAALAVVLATGRVRLRRHTVASGAVIGVALVGIGTLTPLPKAWAHDPGQGPVIGTAVMTATRTGAAVRFTALIDQVCLPSNDSASAIGRRAGNTVTVSATRTPKTASRCRYTATLDLPGPGRWFIYLHLNTPVPPAGSASAGGRLRHGVTAAETWLQLPNGVTTVHSTHALYRTSPSTSAASKTVLAIVLYALVAALLVGAVRISGRKWRWQSQPPHDRCRPRRTDPPPARMPTAGSSYAKCLSDRNHPRAVPLDNPV